MAGLSGRDAARARREELCQQGRGDQAACRPSGRVRQKPANPTKVEQGTTLSGTTVTGTQVERSAKVTGVDAGSCRAITGTEYIGAEQYGELCAAIPEPAPAKVSVGSTSRGQRVSGAELGRSVKVTGDERGACKAVTGTEYLSAEKFETFCATKPVPAPAKVGVAATQAGQRVSGTEVGRSARVTGDEPGSCLKLTGSQYYQPEQFGSLCRGGNGAPHKVNVMNTLRERPLTGTEITPNARVTGVERGACASVTGTESAGLAQYQACNRKPVPAPEKVGVMRTWHEQPVSGTSVEHSPKVTGDEYGACQPVSGTEYVGPDQYAAFCGSDREAASRALMAHRSSGADSVAMTAIRPGQDSKVTGATCGKCQILSGTPYSDTDRLVRQRGGIAQASPHPLTRGPADTSRVAVAAPEVADVRGNFSVTTPARNAQGGELSRITGTAYGAAGRITGPVNLATGLVSGTPEFRYRDEAYDATPVAPDLEVPRSRLTGDGREGGFAITGAAWRRNESITGTEGNSTHRNPTLRGDQRGTVIGASQLKGRERPELPMSRITGSSGNDAKGSAITYSGGARG
ncbi:carboxysome shell peptide mid-region [mine drainage metagenome]|uniref:Carboxysome shell peptide mid-region n=1 Tax=mine drainage metagenome TaxID=410659 RepID=A0A1J5RXY9_9ZZZZ